MKAKTLILSLGALLAATAMPAQAGLLTYQGVTFTSTWKGNVLTLEIDAAKHTGDWNAASGLKAVALKGIGDYTKVSVTAAPKGASGWTVSGNELKSQGCSGDSNGQAGSRLCFYGAQMALADDMVFSFTFEGLGVQKVDPHVKVNFVDARGAKVGSLLSQTLPASPAPAPVPAASTNPAPVAAPVAAASTAPVAAAQPAAGSAGTGTPAPAAATTTTAAPATTPAATETAGTIAVNVPAPATEPAPAIAPAQPAQPVELPAALTPPTGMPLVIAAASQEPVVTDGRVEPAGTATPAPVPAAAIAPVAAKPAADVPEPHGVALLLAGLGVMGITLRRRARAGSKQA